MDLADKVNEMLPVLVTTDDAASSPNLLQLLHSLSHQLRPDGTTTAIDKDMQEAEAALHHQKSRWLQQQILYTELRELLLDQQLSTGHSTPAGSTQFYKAVQEMLTFAEVGDYVECDLDPSSELRLLGISQDDIGKSNPHLRHVQSIQQKLIPEIESRLRQKCEKLVSFYESSKPGQGNKSGDTTKYTFAKASQLPELLQMDRQQVEHDQKQLKHDQAKREKKFWVYYQVLVDSLQVLETLISQHRLQKHHHSNMAVAEWLMIRCDAICSKIKCLQLQILCDTYYSNTIQALSKIKQHLDQAIFAKERELVKIQDALHTYEAVGPSFDKLVQEFTQLSEAVTNKSWALQEFQKHGFDDSTLLT